MKTFTIGGTSTGPDGLRQWRFANGDPRAREAVLIKHHHRDVRFLALPREMTREEGIIWLTEQGISAEILIPGRRAVEVVRNTGNGDHRAAKTVKFVDIDQSVKPKTAAEILARQLHRREPFVRWLAWEHLQPSMQEQLISRARQQIAA